MKKLIEDLQTVINKQSIKIDTVDSKIKDLESENSNLKNELENLLVNVKTVAEKAINESSAVLIQNMCDQQTSFESQTNLLLTTIEAKLATLSTSTNLTSKPGSTSSTTLKLSQPSVSSSYCNKCAQSFSSKRALTEHLKTQHHQQP